MTRNPNIDVYSDLGVRPIINCQSQRTALGGSLLSAEVTAAMERANSSYVVMSELMDRAGQYVADLMGTEAAYVTAGCAAALSLSTAACMAGADPVKRGRLPDTTGMKSEIVIQKRQRYGYDRSLTVAGATLVEAGDEDSCSAEQLDAAIGSNTAAVAYLVEHPPVRPVSLREAVEVAHSRGVPVIADAAAQIYPIDYFVETARSVDLVCFSGKFFGAPNATGFVCGKRALVEAAAAHGFVAFQTQEDGERAFGRTMKIDRQSVIAMTVALKHWLTMDHEDRLWQIDETLARIQSRLSRIPHVTSRIAGVPHYWRSTLHVTLDTGALGITPEDLAVKLDGGDPRIWIGLGAGDFYGARYHHDDSLPPDTFAINGHALNPGEDVIVAERIASVLAG